MTHTGDAAGTGISGEAYIMFAFDIGFEVDLDAAAPLVHEATRKRVVRGRRPAPVWFDYSPAPLTLVLEGEPVALGDRATRPTIEMLVYDFGAALLTYRLALPGTIQELARLGVELYDHAALEADARARVQSVMSVIAPAIERPRLSDAVEDYAVFAITSWDQGASPEDIVRAHAPDLARAIEAESEPLSPEQTERALSGAMSYTPMDLAIVDWNGAILFDREPEDVIAVLQHANIELLELRYLDQELDAILDHADETLAALARSRLWPGFASGRMLTRFASVQTDAAVMFEGVNNAIKLLGNQYLARLYRLGAERLDLPSWQASVAHKLEATESLYAKMSDTTATRRLETLEWVIIILIAVSIVLPFTPLY